MEYMQQILSYLRKAISDYSMIENGDKIAVALSGGKDSITMLYAFNDFRKYFGFEFDLIAISVNPGFDFFDTSFLKELCQKINVPCFIEESHIKEIVFEERKEKNPCSLCANLRRGILNSTAIREGCNKIALGHNKDDVIETFMMNTLYTGNINTFSPVSYMDRSGITLIRPLIYATEKDTRRFIRKNKLSVMPKCCPIDGYSKREDMKLLLESLQKEIPKVKANLFGAIKRSNISGWKDSN